MAREMQAGDSATATIGASGSVIGKQNTSLMNTVTNVIFQGVMLNTLLGGQGSPTMRPGDSMMNTLGGSTEVYSNKPNSDLTKTVMGLVMLGFTAKLLEANTTPPPSQDQMRMEALVKEDLRRAEFAKEDATRTEMFAAEDALKKEEFAKEEARKAFFSRPPRM